MPSRDIPRRVFLRGTLATAGVVVWPRRQAHRRDGFVGTRAGESAVVQQTQVRWCPPGRFTMGSPPSEIGRRADEAQVAVTISAGFWVGAFEVTQREWSRVMGAYPDRPPSARFGLGDNVPVYWVNHEEASAYCSAATRRAHASGELPTDWMFSLPTEAQWEYACRAGSTTASAYGDHLTKAQANIADRSFSRAEEATGRARPVGRYAPNAWGLCDMHGNVWEWCRDWYHAVLPGGTDPDLSATPGQPNRDGTFSRVRRGGAWIEEAWACRSACRLRYEPQRRSDHIGFGVVVHRA